MSREKVAKYDITIHDRIKKLRTHYGYTLTAFAKILGFSHNYLSEVENRKTKPSLVLLYRISMNTTVNLHWLLTGEGEMLRGVPASRVTDIADRPREQLKQWIDDFWKDADEDERAWLIVEMKRQFPEFADWLKKTEQGTSEPDTSSSAGANTV